MAIAAPQLIICTLAVGLAGAWATVAHAQDGVPVVVLTSPAFEAQPVAGELLRFQASVSGGRAPYTFEWDLDGDGAVDRRSAAALIEASFPTRTSVGVGVQVIDADGRRGAVSRTLRVRGPEILVEPEGAVTVLNGQIDPGDFVYQQLRVTNVGDAVNPAGLALFAGSRLQLEIGPSPSGYTAVIQDANACGYSWIELSAGIHETPTLVTSVADSNPRGALNDARTTAIDLVGGRAVLYDGHYARAVMSTNGYLSFDAADSGGDFTPSCDAEFGQTAGGPQLRPLHDDLIVAGIGDVAEAGAGLRYRRFSSCPRRAISGERNACHVFSWSGMRRWNEGNPSERFDFQAIVYEVSNEIVYQYRNPPADAGVAATIGIVNLDGSEAFNASCGVPRVITANSAACFFPASELPITASPAESNFRVIPVAQLAAGESMQTSIVLRLSASARCGQPFGVDYIGTVSDEAQSFGRVRAAEGRVADFCTPNITTIHSPGLADLPRYGLYFDPSRPGNGLVNFAKRTSGFGIGETSRDLFGGAWYTALGDRTPTWYTLAGELVNGIGELAVRRFSNAAAPDGFSTTSEIVGRAWIGQYGLNRALFAWELGDGSTGIELLHTSDRPSGAPNRTQTWFSPMDPGWGLAIESLYVGSPFEFIGAFVYDAEGKARWVVGDSNTNTGGSIQLTGHRPHCPGCPWIADWSSDGQPAGRLQLGYQGQISGTLGTTIQLPPPYRGDWMREALPIQPIAQPVQ